MSTTPATATAAIFGAVRPTGGATRPLARRRWSRHMSLFGGRGKPLHAVLGGIVIAAIANGMGLLGMAAATCAAASP